MSIRQPLKTSERKQLNQDIEKFLSKGGKVNRIPRMKVEDIEEHWKLSLPAGMRARLDRIKNRKQT